MLELRMNTRPYGEAEGLKEHYGADRLDIFSLETPLGWDIVETPDGGFIFQFPNIPGKHQCWMEIRNLEWNEKEINGRFDIDFGTNTEAVLENSWKDIEVTVGGHTFCFQFDYPGSWYGAFAIMREEPKEEQTLSVHDMEISSAHLGVVRIGYGERTKATLRLKRTSVPMGHERVTHTVDVDGVRFDNIIQGTDINVDVFNL